MKKKILIILACLVSVVGVLCGIFLPNSNLNNAISGVENSLIEEIGNEDNSNVVIVTDETKEIVNDTKKATDNGEDISTTEVIESSTEEEKTITDEGATETDGVVDQENISYNGDNTGNGLSLLGAYQGLTYYSQADSRWANVMYSSIGDTSQTIKSSACGPTSAAIIVSSSKGTILPTTMAQLAMSNGYRTSNNGTAWSYFSFVADYFDFEEYYSTSSFNTAMDYLGRDDDHDGNSDYYIIASCGSGLFTSGGHYIALVGEDGDTIQVYDPYLYSGKFNTASRRNAGAVVSGNSVFVSETSFVNYANYRNFWIFSNDSGNGNTNTSNTSNVNYTRYVATQSSPLNVRDNPNGNYRTSLAKGTAVNVIEVNGDWSKINSPVYGWVSSSYLSSSAVTYTNNSSTSSSYTAKITASSLRIRAGAETNYKILGSYSKGTTVNILSTSNGWGKTNKGWIYLGYTTKTSNYSTSVASTDYVLGRYKVTASALNVRTGPGTNYSVKRTYSRTTVFDTYQISGSWARTPSGWVSLNYCSLMYKY